MVEEEYDIPQVNSQKDEIEWSSDGDNINERNESNDSDDHGGDGFCGWMYRERQLLRAIVIIVLLMNIPYAMFLLYPFLIFSTWIHEFCHAMAALMIGGSVTGLEVYPDGSGLTFWSIPIDKSHLSWVVANAGYSGTSIAGGILLLFRRPRWAPHVALTFIGCLVLVTVGFFVRTAFAVSALVLIGLALGACGIFLSSERAGDVFSLVAATCCLNAILSIRLLYSTRALYIGGEERFSDAMMMSWTLFMPYWFWATLWLFLAVFMVFFGIVFAFGRRRKEKSNRIQDEKEPKRRKNFDDAGECTDEPEISVPEITMKNIIV